MNNIIEIINSLQDMIPLKAATATQITDAELQLRVSFSDEYKEYLSTFGAIMADGIELTGIAKAEHRNVVSVTKAEHKLNSKVPNTMYVIENTHIDGVVIWQDATGSVYRTQPEMEPQKIADSMTEYLSGRK